MTYIRGALEDRILPRIWIKPGCWEWQGAIYQQEGYGRCSVRDDQGRWHAAVSHRVVYEIFVGPIPEDLTLDHLCRNRKCVNPAHLEPVSFKENVLRGESIPAKNDRKTHCYRGHPLVGDNLYINPASGGRVCRTCSREWRREYKRKRRQVQH